MISFNALNNGESVQACSVIEQKNTFCKCNCCRLPNIISKIYTLGAEISTVIFRYVVHIPLLKKKIDLKYVIFTLHDCIIKQLWTFNVVNIVLILTRKAILNSSSPFSILVLVCLVNITPYLPSKTFTIVQY